MTSARCLVIRGRRQRYRIFQNRPPSKGSEKGRVVMIEVQAQIHYNPIFFKCICGICLRWNDSLHPKGIGDHLRKGRLFSAQRELQQLEHLGKGWQHSRQSMFQPHLSWNWSKKKRWGGKQLVLFRWHAIASLGFWICHAASASVSGNPMRAWLLNWKKNWSSGQSQRPPPHCASRVVCTHTLSLSLYIYMNIHISTYPPNVSFPETRPC